MLSFQSAHNSLKTKFEVLDRPQSREPGLFNVLPYGTMGEVMRSSLLHLTYRIV